MNNKWIKYDLDNHETWPRLYTDVFVYIPRNGGGSEPGINIDQINLEGKWADFSRRNCKYSHWTDIIFPTTTPWTKKK